MLQIFESQQFAAGNKTWPSTDYRYVGVDAASGLHIFEDNGKRELFAKRKYAPAGWHIKRGAYSYEFCRSAS